ncbi:MAG: Na+/H+ antiporter NhaA [Cytophagaceae bacterium]|jgi:NhaA family Na+:H+ antiporter|nr:Na+/H+ antiporter NhaA [Cytophagaceae bacterium]
MKKIQQILFRFFHNESGSGWILLLSAIAGLVCANMEATAHGYHFFTHTTIHFSWGDFVLEKPLHHWVNDGLMSIFFFVVGLELKREIIAGELSNLKKASLPIIAAVGGMLLPALFYLIIDGKDPEFKSGWGVPMATDIAFVLGIMTLLKDKIPLTLKIFLTALAIVDDLGAVLVIALFYTSTISFGSLLFAGLFLFLLYMMNRLGVRNVWYYAFVGIGGVWIAFLLSGVHATIAGVVAAFFIPARTKISEEEYSNRMKELIEDFNAIPTNQYSVTTKYQNEVLENMREVVDDAQTPLQHLEYGMHGLVSFLVLPLFAFVNAGVVINGSFIDMLQHPVSIGIIIGLVLGKALGVFGFSWIAVKLKIADLPENINLKLLFGVALLAGVGFTMSMFIADLAFVSEELKANAKMAVMVASLFSGVIGYLYFKTMVPDKDPTIE